jgi:hypothetical protein
MRQNRPKEDFTQARAIIGKRHFVLADHRISDRWAVPGFTVLSTELNKEGVEVRSFGPAPTVSTKQLKAFARSIGAGFLINPAYLISRACQGQ